MYPESITCVFPVNIISAISIALKYWHKCLKKITKLMHHFFQWLPRIYFCQPIFITLTDLELTLCKCLEESSHYFVGFFKCHICWRGGGIRFSK